MTIEDIDDADVVNPLLRQQGIRSLLGVPLLAGGDVLGVLHVGTIALRSFDESDVDVLQMVADRVALTIHATLSETERAVSGMLQRSLLPPALPQVPGLDVGLPLHRRRRRHRGRRLVRRVRPPAGGCASPSATSWGVACGPRWSWDGCAAPCGRTRWPTRRPGRGARPGRPAAAALRARRDGDVLVMALLDPRSTGSTWPPPATPPRCSRPTAAPGGSSTCPSTRRSGSPRPAGGGPPPSTCRPARCSASTPTGWSSGGAGRSTRRSSTCVRRWPPGRRRRSARR